MTSRRALGFSYPNSDQFRGRSAGRSWWVCNGYRFCLYKKDMQEVFVAVRTFFKLKTEFSLRPSPLTLQNLHRTLSWKVCSNICSDEFLAGQIRQTPMVILSVRPIFDWRRWSSQTTATWLLKRYLRIWASNRLLSIYQPICYIGVDIVLPIWEVQDKPRIRYPCKNRRAPCGSWISQAH